MCCDCNANYSWMFKVSGYNQLKASTSLHHWGKLYTIQLAIEDFDFVNMK